jgi:hypothetical protein
LYSGGKEPNPSPEDLLAMVHEFAASHGWATPEAETTEQAPIRLGAGSIRDGELFIRIWYLSDGLNFAFVTYVCDWDDRNRELAECEAIVRTIQFNSSAWTTGPA